MHSRALEIPPARADDTKRASGTLPDLANAPEVSSLYQTLSDVRVHYLRAGEGHPLLLLHGTALDSAQLTYGRLIPQLAKRFNVTALDWPGYGHSDKPQLDYTAAFYHKVLCEFIDALELDRPHLVAFSMGGGMALRFALEHPGRVQKLVLIDSYGLGGTVHMPFLPRFALRFPGSAHLIWQGLKRSRRLLTWCLRHLVFGRARRVTPELVREVQQQLELEGLEFAFTNWLKHELGRTRLTTNYRRRLGELRAPTLLVHGTRDLVIPAYRSRRAAKLIPGAQLRLIPGCGHWSPREAPEEVLEALEAFL